MNAATVVDILVRAIKRRVANYTNQWNIEEWVERKGQAASGEEESEHAMPFINLDTLLEFFMGGPAEIKHVLGLTLTNLFL